MVLGGVCALVVGGSYVSKFLFCEGRAWLDGVLAALGVSWLLAFAGLVSFSERTVVPVLIVLGWFVSATSVGAIAVAAADNGC
ncbi:MAG: hypothetical protein E6G32_10720 [Actinobacteria bacterium]|nr:MAG: hypothetical protein E6G32_10720 [Actinomycetota bacterium]